MLSPKFYPSRFVSCLQIAAAPFATAAAPKPVPVWEKKPEFTKARKFLLELQSVIAECVSFLDFHQQ